MHVIMCCGLPCYLFTVQELLDAFVLCQSTQTRITGMILYPYYDLDNLAALQPRAVRVQRQSLLSLTQTLSGILFAKQPRD